MVWKGKIPELDDTCTGTFVELGVLLSAIYGVNRLIDKVINYK